MSDARKTGAGTKGASIVIVGGGVTGLSAGWWLARDGHDVLVIERGEIGGEASGRNGGGCSHHHSPLFVEEQRLWPQMDDLLGNPTEFMPNRIRIAFNEAQMTLYARALANAEKQGFSSEVLDPKQVRELVPLAGENVHGGYFYRFGGHANPHRTLEAYAAAIEDLGGKILEHQSVTGFTINGDRVSGVETTAGAFACDHLVVAAGPAIASLVAKFGKDIKEFPLAAARAEMIVTEPLTLMPIGGIDGNGLYGRQTLRGNLAYGGGPHEWIDMSEELPAKPSSPLGLPIARRLAELLPKAAHARIIRSWAGVIENTPDGRPVIDHLDPFTNVVVATLSGVGFGLSPASGRAIRDLVVEGRCTFADISSLKLARFAKLEPDWRERQGWLPIPAQAPGCASAALST
jgi:sarcosine oxidase subunit beta